MVYGKIVNGEVVLAPVNLVLDDGRTIFNFNKNVELMTEYGYVEMQEPVDLEKLKEDKILLSKYNLAKFLEENPLKSSCHGNVEEYYSVTSEKQALLTSTFVSYQCLKGTPLESPLTWNATGKTCEVWTEEEMVQLIGEIKQYVYPLVTLQQYLETLIMECTTKEEIEYIDVTISIEIAKALLSGTATFTLERPVEEDTKEQIVEQTGEQLTYEIADEIFTSYGLTISQTINYIAVKRDSRLNIATMSNDLTTITIKEVDTFTINNKEDLINIIETHLMGE